jgi:hypothetical protein
MRSRPLCFEAHALRRGMASLHHPSGWGAPLTVGPGFRGWLSNVDVAEESSVSHINIDKSARIQAEIAGEIGAVAKTK